MERYSFKLHRLYPSHLTTRLCSNRCIWKREDLHVVSFSLQAQLYEGQIGNLISDHDFHGFFCQDTTAPSTELCCLARQQDGSFGRPGSAQLELSGLQSGWVCVQGGEREDTGE